MEEALIEMYLAGVSVRRVEDITEAICGGKVSPATISELNKKACVHIEDWRNRPLQGKYPHVYVDGIHLRRNWGEVYSPGLFSKTDPDPAFMHMKENHMQNA